MCLPKTLPPALLQPAAHRREKPVPDPQQNRADHLIPVPDTLCLDLNRVRYRAHRQAGLRVQTRRLRPLCFPLQVPVDNDTAHRETHRQSQQPHHRLAQKPGPFIKALPQRLQGRDQSLTQQAQHPDAHPDQHPRHNGVPLGLPHISGRIVEAFPKYHAEDRIKCHPFPHVLPPPFYGTLLPWIKRSHRSFHSDHVYHPILMVIYYNTSP